MIKQELIEKAVFDLCSISNTTLEDEVFEKLLFAYNNETNKESKQALELILKNAVMSAQMQKPLCQDTGQVLVFVKIGEKVQTENLNQSINQGVKKAYLENYYRKSVVKNALQRENTQDNTPCIIYTEITQGHDLELSVLIKGAGAENMSCVKMMPPTSSNQDIVEFITNEVKKAGTKACPPLFIGIGIGGTMEYSALLSKKALISKSENQNSELSDKIKNSINKLNIGASGLGGKFTALDVKIQSDFTHIACMPVSLTINCHSSRHACCLIKDDGKDEIKILSKHEKIKNFSLPSIENEDILEINTNDTKALKSLKVGDNIVLTGEIYTARDMAHKKIIELIEQNKPLPLEMKDSIIFYAGPCPCAENETIGPIGPTTASRMDSFTPTLYDKGVLATIGKGDRSEEVKASIKKNGGIYFSTLGGVACYLKTKILKKELVAFEELGAEAIYKLQVHRFPVRVDLI